MSFATKLKRKRFSVEQITNSEAGGARHADRRALSDPRSVGTELLPVQEDLRRHGGPWEARELKQLRKENIKLKRLVADLSLDKAMLQDVPRKEL
jgi:putative transposase